jgi:hypothetical protein
VNDVPAACLNFDENSKTYTEAQKVVEQAKSGATRRVKVGSTVYAVAALGLFFPLLF